MAEKNKETLVTTRETSHSDEEVFTPRGELGQQRDEKLTFIEKWWLWEFFALFVCFAALMGVVGFLKPADQKPVAKWVISQTVGGFSLGFSVSINSVLSIFSTLIKSMVLIPVAEGIGQLKWLWFSDGHRLSDFQRFQAAESGALGAFLLIWTMKGRSLVCLGALIVIASLALDFSFQQLITYPPVPKQVGTAYMPATSTYSSHGTKISSAAEIAYPIPDAGMRLALTVGSEGLSTSVPLEPQCSTGNCTWSDTVVTLGVCSECHDTTANLKESCEPPFFEGDTGKYCNYTLPNGLTLSSIIGNDSFYTIFTASSGSANTSFLEDLQSPIVVLSTIGIQHNYSTVIPAFSNQCALSFCVQKYNVSMRKGNLTSTLIDVHQDRASVHDENGDLHIVAPAEFMRDSGHPDSVTFTVTSDASAGLGYGLTHSDAFRGSIQMTPPVHSAGETDFLTYIFPMDTAQLTQAMAYIAGNMTNAIRMSAATPASSATKLGIGAAFQDVPKVNVVWWWLFVPATLLVMTFVFLVGTVIASRKRGALPWKKNALASFYHPLSEDGRHKLAIAQGPTDLWSIAENVSVKRELTEKGYRMVPPQTTEEQR